MNRIFNIFILGFLVVACTSNTIMKKPDDLIPKDQMVDLITDMLLASAGENIKNIHLERRVNYFPIIYDKYQIDSIRFMKSNFYYTSRIDDYDEILKKVEVRLNDLRKKYEKERLKEDSIIGNSPELRFEE